MYRRGRRISFSNCRPPATSCFRPAPRTRSPNPTGATSHSWNTWSSYRLSRDAEPWWHRATRLTDGCEVLLPADLCLRRPAGQCEVDLPFMLGTGSAAGTSWDAAALHGLLELIERDAAGLWWRGGRRARTISPRHEASLMADDLLVQLRANAATQRRSWLLGYHDRPRGALRRRRLLSAGWPRFRLRPCGAANAKGRSPLCRPGNVSDRTWPSRSRKPSAASAGKPRQRARTVSHLRRATLINCDRCLLLQPAPERTEQDFTEQDFTEHLANATTDPRAVHQLDCSTSRGIRYRDPWPRPHSPAPCDSGGACDCTRSPVGTFQDCYSAACGHDRSNRWRLALYL